ncbi:MAG: hypothetical protein HYX60_10355 [Legionella longbeachae]|nr:hypothetical protein [Legionella longbeachae]
MYYKEEVSKKENEENEIKIFLENSIEFQKMKIIANKPGMEHAKNIFHTWNNANRFMN